MSRSNRETEDEIREAIESNLKTMKDAIDDYEMTPDSADFIDETAKLRENLLKLALKYHILIEGRGSEDLHKAVKKQNRDLAVELKTLANKSKKTSERLGALNELNNDIAAELILTVRALGTYKLSQDELNKRAIETLKKVGHTTKALRQELQKELSIKQTTPKTVTPAKSDNVSTSKLKRTTAIKLFDKSIVAKVRKEEARGEKKEQKETRSPKLTNKNSD